MPGLHDLRIGDAAPFRSLPVLQDGVQGAIPESAGMAEN